jgi:hypothetical protein
MKMNTFIAAQNYLHDFCLPPALFEQHWLMVHMRTTVESREGAGTTVQAGTGAGAELALEAGAGTGSGPGGSLSQGSAGDGAQVESGRESGQNPRGQQYHQCTASD